MPKALARRARAEGSRPRPVRPAAPRPVRPAAPRPVAAEPAPPTVAGPAPDLARAARLGHRPGGYAVQRTLYDSATHTLHVPRSYADVQIPWDDELGYATKVKSDEDPKLEQLVADHKQTFLGFLSASVGQAVYHLKVDTDNEAQDEVMKYIPEKGKMRTSEWKGLYKPVAKKLLKIFNAHQKYVVVPPEWGDYFYTKETVDPQWALLPKDMVPEKPDLPASGESVTEKPNGVPTAWNLVCSLIALVKAEDDDSYAKTKQVSKKDEVDDLDTAVQALHDHYLGLDEKVEYDDTSTHRTLMSEWGYDLVFSGPVAWNQLHNKLKMEKADAYVVDITGHTVLMTVKKKPPEKGVDMADPSEYYEFHSDAQNYEKDELDQAVEYVYKK